MKTYYIYRLGLCTKEFTKSAIMYVFRGQF